ncbi:hypothetical protein D3C77_502400 [compost metagenome]
MGTATNEQGEHRCRIGQVEHRHRVQEHSVFTTATLPQSVHRGERDVVVTEHHPFREAGGTSGVEDAQQFITAAACIFYRFALRDQCFITEHAGWRRTVTRVNQVPHCFHLIKDTGSQLLVVIVDDQY